MALLTKTSYNNLNLASLNPESVDLRRKTGGADFLISFRLCQFNGPANWRLKHRTRSCSGTTRLYSVQCTVQWTVQCTVYNTVDSAVYSVQYCTIGKARLTDLSSQLDRNTVQCGAPASYSAVHQRVAKRQFGNT